MSDGWPTLGDSRGRGLFMLIAGDEQRAEYTSGFRHLEGRVMFVEAKPDEYEQSWAAVAKVWPEPSATLRRARELRLAAISAGIARYPASALPATSPARNRGRMTSEMIAPAFASGMAPSRP